MSEKTRLWVKDNVLLLIITVMLTAFFVQYQSDRTEFKEVNDRQDIDIQDLKVITYNLANVWGDDKVWKRSVDDKLSKHDEEFMELWKQTTRSGKPIKP